MKLSLLLGAILAQQALSAPTGLENRDIENRDIFDRINPLETVLLFDSPAFQDPANPANLIASFRSFVHLNQIDFGIVASVFTDFLESFGIDIGNSAKILEERIRLFGAVGLPGKEVTVNVDGCGRVAELAETEFFPNLGMLERNISIGACNGNAVRTAKVDLSFIDRRVFQGTVFPSPPTGFGVISDVDDTIKISNVLDTLATLRSTFLEDTKFVPGMPELFSSLKTKLDNPQFLYLSGSPFQLYPMLHKFVNDNYQPGPILLQNLTFIDIPGMIDFLQGATAEYKSERIDTIHGWYPAKKFLTIGDSTQADPEVYGAAFNRFGGNFIHCIWIRRVEGADNSAERFAKAFAGVPANRVRVFSDPKELMALDVAGGQC